MDTVLAVFDGQKAARIPLSIRVEAAQALGRTSDPRLRENRWISLVGGRFVMGEGQGAHEVEVKSFEIGKYPVTVEEFGRFVEEGGPEPDSWDTQVVFPNQPVRFVNWHEAAAYCEWAEARLPTEAEWEYAARGSEGRRYPWGSESAGCDPRKL
jgi:formylglycine-generating enzyme required for sulfatase activity